MPRRYSERKGVGDYRKVNSIDIRKHDKPISFKALWMLDQFQKIRQAVSPDEMSNDEIKSELLSEYEKRKSLTGRFYNSVTKENEMMTVEQYLNTFLNDKTTILTGYNVLIKNQKTMQSIAIDALKNILDMRSVYKKDMLKYDKGSYEYTYFNTQQKTTKVLANSYYGIQSMSSSTFYNPHIQNSITQTGWDLISSAIYLVEDFVANNEKFRHMDDLLTLVSQVKDESYDVTESLDPDKNITPDALEGYLLGHCDFDCDREMLHSIVANCDQNQRNKIYYKNQILKLFENSKFKNKLIEDCAKEDYDGDPDLVKESVDACLFNRISSSRFERITMQKRQASIVTDTDSTFVYLGNVLSGLRKETGSENMQTLTNFMIAVITEALRRTFWLFTGNCGIPEDYRPIINMKNEFVYSRIMTTANKKSYAGWLKYELGKEIPGTDPDKHLDIKGLSIRKSTVAKNLRVRFQDLLTNDILTPEKISISSVMRTYGGIADTVEKSLREGKTEYLIPNSVARFDTYQFPGRIPAVRAVIAWNALEPNDEIVPPDNVRVIKLTCTTKDGPGMMKLKSISQEKYDVICKSIFNSNPGEIDISSKGFAVVALPQTYTSIPKYIVPIIDYDKMINTNIGNANILLESLGIYCVDVNGGANKTKTNYKSNMIDI
jgi:hypothetical protein